MIGIDANLDYLLDPQQAIPAGQCPICGAEIWGIGQDVCGRCGREEES